MRHGYGVSAAMGSSTKGDDSKQIKISETSVIDSDRQDGLDRQTSQVGLI